MFLVVLVMHEPSNCDDLLPAWREAGIPGATIFESLGLQRALKHGARDDVPLFPGFEDLEEGEEHHNRTMFSVVPDQATVDRLIVATEKVLGPLEGPDNGILFVVPVSQVVGLRSNY